MARHFLLALKRRFVAGAHVRVPRLPNAFLLTLTGTDSHARMPTVDVMWSLRFGQQRPRDDLFAWLATHIDRWNDWG